MKPIKLVAVGAFGPKKCELTTNFAKTLLKIWPDIYPIIIVLKLRRKFGVVKNDSTGK